MHLKDWVGTFLSKSEKQVDDLRGWSSREVEKRGEVYGRLRQMLLLIKVLRQREGQDETISWPLWLLSRLTLGYGYMDILENEGKVGRKRTEWSFYFWPIRFMPPQLFLLATPPPWTSIHNTNFSRPMNHVVVGIEPEEFRVKMARKFVSIITMELGLRSQNITTRLSRFSSCREKRLPWVFWMYPLTVTMCVEPSECVTLQFFCDCLKI